MIKKHRPLKIKQSTYDKHVEVARQLEKLSEEIQDDGMPTINFGKNDIPDKDDLIRHNVVEKLEFYLPFLVYYREVYKPTDEVLLKNYNELQAYLDELFADYLVLIPDECFVPLQKNGEKDWVILADNLKKKRFRFLKDYYDFSDKEDLRDLLQTLGWQRWMAHYKVKKLKYSPNKKLVEAIYKVLNEEDSTC